LDRLGTEREEALEVVSLGSVEGLGARRINEGSGGVVQLVLYRPANPRRDRPIVGLRALADLIEQLG
jgi:hypothetical protein